MRRRVWITIAALILGLVVGDRVIGPWLLERGLFRGGKQVALDLMPGVEQGPWFDIDAVPPADGESREVLGSLDLALGWTNRPGTVGVTQQFAINSLGARGAREYAPRSSGDSVRLLCFGESSVYGSEVADDEAWPAQLEQLDPRIEALNFGVAGYGADQALLRFRSLGQDLGARAACLGITLDVIARSVNRYRVLNRLGQRKVSLKPRFVLEEEQLRLISIPFATRAELARAVLDGSIRERMAEHEYWDGDVRAIPGSAAAKVLAAGAAEKHYSARQLWVESSGEPFRVTLAVLEAFGREALEAGIAEPVILLFPTRADSEEFPARYEPYAKQLVAALEGRDVPCIDLGPLLQSAGEKQRLFGSLHLNRAGNAIVAERMRAWLDQSPHAQTR